MKKFFYALLIPVMFFASACSDDDDNAIEFPKGQETRPTFKADDETGNLRFTADDEWEAFIEEATRATPSWISLSQYSGPAGSYNLTITMDINYTGEKRVAVIKLQTSGSTKTVRVTQEATAKDGTVPGEPGQVLPYDKLISRIIYNGSDDEYIEFRYNSNNQVTKVVSHEGDFEEEMTFTYVGNTVAYEYTERDGDDVTGPVKFTMTLNSAGYAQSVTATDGSYWNVTYNDGYISRVTGSYNDYEEENLIPYDHSAEWTNGNLTRVNQENMGAILTYGNVVNNAKMNLDLNWIVGGLEGSNFLVNDYNSLHTEILSGMGLYGKRSANLMSSATEYFNGEVDSYIRDYEYRTDTDGYVTKVISGDNDFDIVYITANK